METEQIRITRKTIIGCTAAIFGVQPSDITGPKRENLLVRARWVCALLFREHDPKVSNPQIGDALGRDHTTAIHALRAGAKLARTDERFAAKLDACRRKVRAWRPTGPQTVVLAPGRAEVAPEPKSPPAREFDAPDVIPVKPLIRQRATRYGTEYFEGGMDLQWWSANDRRFRAAMLRAHPERAPAAMREAAE